MFALLICLQAIKTFATHDSMHVQFRSDKYTLSGRVTMPKERNHRMPAVIFLVGSGGNSSHTSNYSDFTDFFLEQKLLDKGMALMYFDKRGVGQSEGNWSRTDFGQRALDAKNAAVYLKTLPFIDSTRIFLVGHSQGGWIVQVCLAQYPEHFAGGISMAGATFGVKEQLINDYRSTYICGTGDSTELAYLKAERKVKKVLAFTSVFPLKKDWRQLKRIRKFEPAAYLVKINRPILFMWGENDRLVSHEWCTEALNKLFPKGLPQNFQTYIGKGENHSFKLAAFCYAGKAKDTYFSEVSRDRMVSWLLSHQ